MRRHTRSKAALETAAEIGINATGECVIIEPVGIVAQDGRVMAMAVKDVANQHYLVVGLHGNIVGDARRAKVARHLPRHTERGCTEAGIQHSGRRQAGISNDVSGSATSRTGNDDGAVGLQCHAPRFVVSAEEVEFDKPARAECVVNCPTGQIAADKKIVAGAVPTGTGNDDLLIHLNGNIVNDFGATGGLQIGNHRAAGAEVQVQSLSSQQRAVFQSLSFRTASPMATPAL